MLSFLLIVALAGGMPAGSSRPALQTGPPLAAATQAPEPPQQTATTTPGRAQPWEAGTLEIGALGGYAVGKVYELPRVPSHFGQFLLRFGVNFGATGSGWMRGNISIVAEGVGTSIDQQPRAQGGGLNLLFGYTWAAGRWRPRFLGGAGILFTNREVPPGETTFNFTPQAGVGISYLLNSSWALDGEYRFHHLSNKGKTETNPGINSHLFLFGVSWFR